MTALARWQDDRRKRGLPINRREIEAPYRNRSIRSELRNAFWRPKQYVPVTVKRSRGSRAPKQKDKRRVGREPIAHPEFREMYNHLVKLVGMKEARRMVDVHAAVVARRRAAMAQRDAPITRPVAEPD